MNLCVFVRIELMVLLIWSVLSGCSSQDSSTESSAAVVPVQFSDITKEAGITFKHHTGARGLKWIPEVMGSGVAFIDVDGDDYQDIFFVNGRDWTPAEIENYATGNGKEHLRQHGFVIPPAPAPQRATCVLYHNNGNGTFTDVTRGSGLDIEVYGMGVCVGDYDNDGRSDIYVTALGRNYLFRNTTQGSKMKFEEVAAKANVKNSGWSIAATWLDYDRDGKLDLFVSHYLDWRPALDFWLATDKTKSYAGPEHYKPVSNTLYHNEGQGRFTDVSQRARITQEHRAGKVIKHLGKAMSLVTCDYNNDGWPDVVVTNDLMPNHLFRNNRNGTFSEVAHEVGIVYGNASKARSGMGVDAADIDHSNRESIAITNFASEMIGLYQNQGNGTFIDIAAQAGVAQPSYPYVGFGCLFTDYNNDGWPDLVVVNGHVYNRFETTIRGLNIKHPPLLFRNQGLRMPINQDRNKVSNPMQDLFQEVSRESGDGFKKLIVGRGLASGDIDLDGDADLVITVNSEPALLLRNEGGNRNNSLRVTLRGSKSNRDAIGAVVWAEITQESESKPQEAKAEETTASKQDKQDDVTTISVRRRVRSGSSYLSQSELPVTLGLGQATHADVVIRWPSGKLMKLNNIAANQSISVHEDKGIILKRPFNNHSESRK